MHRSGYATVTLNDVAKHAGVSRATVSLVIRGSPLVASDTRSRVLEAVESLGYVYNRGAASLRSRRSQSIGLVITDINNPFYSELAVGIEAELDAADYVMLLGTSGERLSKQDRLLEAAMEYRVDGVILCPAQGTPSESIERLQRSRVPFVLAVRYLFNTDVDYVGADNVLGAELAVKHLISHGHRRIAFVGGPAASSARRDRLRGYLNGMEAHGLVPEDALLVNTPVTRDGGHSAVLRLMSLPDPPTAVLCYNDIVAFGVMLGAQVAGRVIGTDLAVVGFDDVAEASLWRPALTTVAVSAPQIGREAARLLLDRLSHPNIPPRRTIFSPKLVVRESCGMHSPIAKERSACSEARHWGGDLSEPATSPVST